MVNKSMRCASKAAEKAAMRSCSGTAAIATASEAAGASPSAPPTTQPAAVTDAGARGKSSASALDEYEIELIYSGESDHESDSKGHAAEVSEPARSGSDNALTRARRLDLFGSSDESDPPSPRRSRSVESVEGSGSGHRQDTDGDAIMCYSPDNRIKQSVDAIVDTKQEVADRNVLRLAPEKSPWLPSRRVLLRLTDTTSERHRIKLFDSSKLHKPDLSANNFGTEHDFFIDAFFKHRWYNWNHNCDGSALIQAWNAFIHNVEVVGRDAWMDKLRAARDRFEKRTCAGARFTLHRLSREAGLPCLSWGDPCQCCKENVARASKEAFSMTDPWWRVRVTQEMYDGIADLQSLYKNENRSFLAVPSSPSDEPRRTSRSGPKRQLTAESEAPRYLLRVGSPATGRENSSDVPSRRAGSVVVPQGSVDRRAHPSMDVEEEETRSQTGSQSLSDSVCQLERATRELRDDLEPERNRRLDLQGLATRLASEREKDRSQFAFAQLENEREQRALRDELVEAHQDVSRLRGEISEFQTRADNQHRDHKNLLEMFERKGILHRKRPRTGDTA